MLSFLYACAAKVASWWHTEHVLLSSKVYQLGHPHES